MTIEYDIPQNDPIPKRLLVVGSPRSGTQFATIFLNKLGLRVRHERMGADGTVNAAWLANRLVDDSLLRVHGRQHFEFDKIVHLVRHPYPTISSLTCEMHSAFWRWQFRHTGIEIDTEDISTVAEFWLFWTDGCTKLADSTIRMEDIAHLGEPANQGHRPRFQVAREDFTGELQATLDARLAQYGYKP